MTTRRIGTAPAPAPAPAPATASYEHKAAEALIRPEVGVQARFKKRKPPAKYAYDPSLAPTMQWDRYLTLWIATLSPTSQEISRLSVMPAGTFSSWCSRITRYRSAS